ncbi:DUF418 domain-containing protein [Viridibacillus sp. YIM B01967]|uniref:DUF418 domain-containing protein n=1 Tax=Viridibacillus soli TaxID=2798301 RepID=A0ABS1H370_9BACL|nr:DUF418 domain-containing protein [Viridibacillus soli]MBK3493861.1 DUF418 domain-containing protein [Viridibacillus soli]
MNPSISQKERIISLDIIRGLALFGILLINVAAFNVIIEGDPLPDYSGINGIISTLITILVEKKFFSIFSFLFGAGLYIFTSRAESRGDKPRWRMARRLLALLLLGVIHMFIFWGTILPIYSIVGLILIPFYRTKVSTLKKWLVGSVTIYIVSLIVKIFLPSIKLIAPILDFFSNDLILIFIMFLAGFLTAKANWFVQIKRLSKQIRWIQIGTCVLFIVFSIWIWNALQSGDHNVKFIIELGAIPATLFYLSTLFLLLENKLVVKLLRPIARVGQMAFTNYIAQSIIGTTIISLIGLEVVSPKDVVYIAILIYVIQIIFSIVWFKFFPMGPLEKVWRFMTYGKKSVTK